MLWKKTKRSREKGRAGAVFRMVRKCCSKETPERRPGGKQSNKLCGHVGEVPAWANALWWKYAY